MNIFKNSKGNGTKIIIGAAIVLAIIIFGGTATVSIYKTTPNSFESQTEFSSGEKQANAMFDENGNDLEESAMEQDSAASSNNGIVLTGADKTTGESGAEEYSITKDQSMKLQMSGMNTEMSQMKSRLAQIENESERSEKIGKDGINGKDGKDGIDGKDGVDGKNGEDGKDGRNGYNGISGQDGKDGKNGENGKDGEDGANGRDGVNGADGKNVFIMFSDNENGTAMTASPTNKRYMGVCNGNYETAPTDPAAYKWTKISEQTTEFVVGTGSNDPNKVYVTVY